MQKFQLIMIIRLILLFSYLFQESIAGCSLGKNTPSNCECGEYELEDLDNSIKLTNQRIKLKYNTMSNSIIGSGGFANIYHAFWQSRNKCVALKSINMSQSLRHQRERIRLSAENEVQVLEYFKNLAGNQKDHIINIYGYQQKTNADNIQFMYIVLELAGINLLNYFNKMIEANYNQNVVLINILICSAQALKQFHNHGIHMDIKATNFVIPHNHNLAIPLVSCKLIDFGTSIITNNNQITINQQHFGGTLIYMAPEMDNQNPPHASRKSDIYSFGVMIYKYLYSPNDDISELNIRLIRGYELLDRIILGCLRENPNDRPSAKAIYQFLKGNCHRFRYEQNMLQVNEILCAE